MRCLAITRKIEKPGPMQSCPQPSASMTTFAPSSSPTRRCEQSAPSWQTVLQSKVGRTLTASSCTAARCLCQMRPHFDRSCCPANTTSVTKAAKRPAPLERVILQLHGAQASARVRPQLRGMPAEQDGSSAPSRSSSDPTGALWCLEQYLNGFRRRISQSRRQIGDYDSG